jgi:hypothetical protein
MRIVKFFRIVWAILREISDENAYHRYLAIQGLQPSRENWRIFSDQRMCATYRKPKCC